LIPIRTYVSVGASAAPPEYCRTRVFSLAHSGQRMPTEVVVMQSGQIGRPQLEHETRVSRPGWR
jgi:hypothetical protein